MRGIGSISRFTRLRNLLFGPPPPQWKPYRPTNSRSMLSRNTPFKPSGSAQTDATPVVVSEDDSFGKKQTIERNMKVLQLIQENITTMSESEKQVLRQLLEETPIMSERRMQVIRHFLEEMPTMSERGMQVLRQLREETPTMSESEIQENPFYVLVLEARKCRGVIDKLPSKIGCEVDKMVASLSSQIEATQNEIVMYCIGTTVFISAVGIAVLITTPKTSIKTSSGVSDE